MQAKVKCSNCGAEITNLSMNWRKRDWLWMLLVFVPLIAFYLWVELPRGDYTADLRIQLLERRVRADRVDVLARLENRGTHDWEYIHVEAEVYDSSGRYLDESSDVFPGTIRPGGTENVRISFCKPIGEVLDSTTSVRVKVSGASRKQF